MPPHPVPTAATPLCTPLRIRASKRLPERTRNLVMQLTHVLCASFPSESCECLRLLIHSPK